MDREKNTIIYFLLGSCRHTLGMEFPVFPAVAFSSPSSLPSLMLQVGLALLSWWMQTLAKVFTAAVKSQKWEKRYTWRTQNTPLPKHSTLIVWGVPSLNACRGSVCLPGRHHCFLCWRNGLISPDFSILLIRTHKGALWLWSAKSHSGEVSAHPCQFSKSAKEDIRRQIWRQCDREE